MDRVPCKKCEASVLRSTIGRTDGYCMPCFKGPNNKSPFQRVEDKAVRMGIMQDSDRIAHLSVVENEADELVEHPESGL